MSKQLIKTLLIAVISFIVLVILFNYNIIAGILAIAIGVAVIAFFSRASIYLIRGNVKYSKGDLSDALTLYEKAYLTGRCKTGSLISYSYLLLRAGQIQKSEELLNSVLVKNLTNDEKMIARSNLALVLWKKGEIDEAASVLEEVFENYKNTNVYGSLGYMLILKGDLEKALEFNLAAYEYNNSNSVILDNLGQTYFLRGEYDKAEEIYNKLMETKPTAPGVYYNYGLLLSAIGQTEKALESLKKALGYKINFLSGVTDEEIKNKIEELEKGLAN